MEDAGAQCVAIDPTDSSRVYAGTFDEGLFRSLDGGDSWTHVSDAIPHDRIMSMAFSPARSSYGRSALYVGTEPSSIYRSEDDGGTWEDLATLRDLPSQPTWSFPPRPWTSHVRWMATHPTDPKLLYSGIELGGVMVTRDGGATWEDRKPGSYHDSHALATHPLAPERVYEAAGEGVSWSQDAGRSWHQTDEGLQHRYVWGLAVDQLDPDCWYVSAAAGPGAAHRNDGNAGAGLYRKRVSEAWELIIGGSSGLPQSLPYMPYVLAAPNAQPESLFAAFQNGDIWQSDDQGDSWIQLGLTGQLPALQALAMS